MMDFKMTDWVVGKTIAKVEDVVHERPGVRTTTRKFIFTDGSSIEINTHVQVQMQTNVGFWATDAEGDVVCSFCGDKEDFCDCNDE